MTKHTDFSYLKGELAAAAATLNGERAMPEQTAPEPDIEIREAFPGCGMWAWGCRTCGAWMCAWGNLRDLVEAEGARHRCAVAPPPAVAENVTAGPRNSISGPLPVPPTGQVMRLGWTEEMDELVRAAKAVTDAAGGNLMRPSMDRLRDAVRAVEADHAE